MGTLKHQLPAISRKIRLSVFPFKSELADVHQVALSFNRRDSPGGRTRPALAPSLGEPARAQAGRERQQDPPGKKLL